ncbi:MAG: ABC transporter permease [Pseudomonadota bacterium]|nr:ABC transporter permease [Pseudomonadota bacterium]
MALVKKEPFFWITISCGLVIMAFILLPLVEMVTAPSAAVLKETIQDKEVLRSIWLSLYTAGAAALISVIIGTPFAYLLARTTFPGKNLVEAIIDIPIIIPHPVVGIALLSIAGRNYWLGKVFNALGIRIMGSVTGIIMVLTFVGLPFYLNAAREGFAAISPRLESVSRSLGASQVRTFFHITLPLAWRSILIGVVMCSARAISEFGAVVIIAYHPMIAPVLIYERFESMGLKYSQPVAVWLISLCLLLFLLLRVLTLHQKRSV